MTIKQSIIKAEQIAKETKVGVSSNMRDHRIIVMIAELILKYGVQEIK